MKVVMEKVEQPAVEYTHTCSAEQVDVSDIEEVEVQTSRQFASQLASSSRWRDRETANNDDAHAEMIFHRMEEERAWRKYWEERLAWDGQNLELLQEFDLLRASEMKHWTAITEWPRWQEVPKNHFMKPNDEYLIILFVSHRWESIEHPDPYGTQLKVIAKLLASLHRLARASRSNDVLRLALVPSLGDSETLLIAAYLLGELSI